MNIQELLKCAEAYRELLREKNRIKEQLSNLEDELNELGLTRLEIRALKRQAKGEVYKRRTGKELPPNRVYFLLWRDADLVKIGTSRTPDARVKNIQSKIKAPLELLGTVPGGFPEERHIHKYFHQYRENGEWFNYSHSLSEQIAEIISVGVLPDEVIL